MCVFAIPEGTLIKINAVVGYHFSYNPWDWQIGFFLLLVDDVILFSAE